MALGDQSGWAGDSGKPSRLAGQEQRAVMLFAGRKRPADGWDQGRYTATYVVKRDGEVVLTKEFELTP